MTNSERLFSFLSHLAEGECVKFLKGPFAGFIGTLEMLGSHGRIRVLLDLRGCLSVIQSNASQVAPVAAHAPTPLGQASG